MYDFWLLEGKGPQQRILHHRIVLEWVGRHRLITYISIQERYLFYFFYGSQLILKHVLY